MAYAIHLLTVIGIYTILAQSLNVVLGLGGLFTLAHVATYGLGAYTTAILTVDYQLPLIAVLPLSMLIGSLGSFFVAFTASRLSDEYFALATLAFHYVVSAIFINWRTVTRGVMGIPGIPDASWNGFEFPSGISFCLLVWSLAAVTSLLLFTIFGSPFSRRLRAQAESDVVAQSLGIPTPRVRIAALALAGALSGLAGCLFAYFLRFIDPSSFALPEITLVLTMVIIGRPGNFWGCIAAVFFMVLLPESLRFIDWLQSYPGLLGPMRQFMFASVLFLGVFLLRDKLFITGRKV